MGENDGLVFAYILDGKGGGQAANWEQMKQWAPQEGILWVHLDYASESVKGWLSEDGGLSPITAMALLSEETRPRFLLSSEGLLLILRGVNFNPGADPEDMVSLRMFLTEHRVVTMRHRKVMAINDIHNAIASDNGPNSSADFLTMICRRITDRLGEVIAGIDDTVDELEDEVLTGQSYELRPRLSNIRRQAISLRRYVAPQRDVVARFQNEHIPWLDDMHRSHLREIWERTARFIEDIDSFRERAAVTQEELNNRLSEEMTKTMYVLSIIAAIFLPLGLLTGLLGINVGGIPGSQNEWAFAIVVFSLIGIGFVLLGWFKRLKWL